MTSPTTAYRSAATVAHGARAALPLRFTTKQDRGPSFLLPVAGLMFGAVIASIAIAVVFPWSVIYVCATLSFATVGGLLLTAIAGAETSRMIVQRGIITLDETGVHLQQHGMMQTFAWSSLEGVARTAGTDGDDELQLLLRKGEQLREFSIGPLTRETADTLCRRLEEEILERNVPMLARQLRDGGTLPVGDATATREGLQLGDETIAWRAIESSSVREGCVVFHRREGDEIVCRVRTAPLLVAVLRDAVGVMVGQPTGTRVRVDPSQPEAPSVAPETDEAAPDAHPGRLRRALR